MATRKSRAVVVGQLDRMAPAMRDAKAGTTLQELITAHNALVTAYNVLVAKLNADAGVTDTNYAAVTTATVGDLGSR